MPFKFKKPCAFQGCPNLTKETYCEEHKVVREKEYETYNLSHLKEFFKSAFNWSDSIEGYGFWKEIHDKWYSLVILFYNNGN